VVALTIAFALTSGLVDLKMPEPIRPAKRIEIHQINNLPAAASPLAPHLLETGFEKDGAHLVLWPSGV